jgi:NAD(P)-dependent dehydrogenase (short-subunit alcohol dehydrogenase family)
MSGSKPDLQHPQSSIVRCGSGFYPDIDTHADMTTTPGIPAPLSRYQPPPDLLRGRFILVTGAADGVGRAVALACARTGATVLALDRKRRKLETLYDEIADAGLGEPILIPHNLEGSDPSAYEDVAGGIAHDAGRLDGIAHIAGILPGFSALHRLKLDEWAAVMQVNLYAPYLLTRACLPLLHNADSASVVFTSAAAGRRGAAYWGAYAVAYGGIERLSEIFADELEANTSIRFNTLDTGPVATDMRSRTFPGEVLAAVSQPGEIAPAYLFLLGPNSETLSGRAFDAQGASSEEESP